MADKPGKWKLNKQCHKTHSNMVNLGKRYNVLWCFQNLLPRYALPPLPPLLACLSVCGWGNWVIVWEQLFSSVLINSWITFHQDESELIAQFFKLYPFQNSFSVLNHVLYQLQWSVTWHTRLIIWVAITEWTGNATVPWFWMASHFNVVNSKVPEVWQPEWRIM